MAEIEKIVIHYKDKTTKVVKKGMVAYEEPFNNLNAAFLEIEEDDIPVIIQALLFALRQAQQMAPKKGK